MLAEGDLMMFALQFNVFRTVGFWHWLTPGQCRPGPSSASLRFAMRIGYRHGA